MPSRLHHRTTFEAFTFVWGMILEPKLYISPMCFGDHLLTQDLGPPTSGSSHSAGWLVTRWWFHSCFSMIFECSPVVEGMIHFDSYPSNMSISTKCGPSKREWISNRDDQTQEVGNQWKSSQPFGGSGSESMSSIHLPSPCGVGASVAGLWKFGRSTDGALRKRCSLWNRKTGAFQLGSCNQELERIYIPRVSCLTWFFVTTPLLFR